MFSAKVTLAVPWLSSHEQAGLFPDSLMFHRPEEQEAYIKKVRAGTHWFGTSTTR